MAIFNSYVRHYQRVRDLQDSAGLKSLLEQTLTSHSNTWKSNKAEADSVQNRLKLRKMDMNNAWISDRFMFHFNIMCLQAKINTSQIFLQASQGHVLRPPLLLDGRIQLFGTTLGTSSSASVAFWPIIQSDVSSYSGRIQSTLRVKVNSRCLSLIQI